MKREKKFVIANWKCQKTQEDVINWFDEFSKLASRNTWDSNMVEVIICPTFIHLLLAKQQIHKHSLPVLLGAQDVSPFSLGSFTGEIAASQLSELVTYVIIGHSERRQYFQEDTTILDQKVYQAHKSGIMPIFCIQDKNTNIPAFVNITAYEPIAAIGTGNPENPRIASEIALHVKKKAHIQTIIYGGSVKAENAHSFIEAKGISGVLIGGVSLAANSFLEIIHAACV